MRSPPSMRCQLKHDQACGGYHDLSVANHDEKQNARLRKGGDGKGRRKRNLARMKENFILLRKKKNHEVRTERNGNWVVGGK